MAELTEDELALMARKLALLFIAEDAKRGRTESDIRTSWHGYGTPDSRKFKFPKSIWTPYRGLDVSIGGYYDFNNSTGLARKRVPNTKVLVSRVCNVKGVWIFSLHELYMESQKGQLQLF